MVSRPDRHPIDDATEIVDRVLDLIGPPPSAPADPAETWRATFAASGQYTSAKLRETQKALAASQADLTRVEAENAELAADNAGWRATAERYLAAQEQLARELATARHQNRILTAENEAALRALNEKERHD